MVALAGWMNRQQQDAISYLRTENRILREKLGHKRILLNDAQKRRLPFVIKSIGLTTIPSPPRPVSSSHQFVPSSWLAGSVKSTILYGVASSNLGSWRQMSPSVSMCQVWSRSTCTFPSVAIRWNGASFRSSSEFTGQQYWRYDAMNSSMASCRLE